MMSASRTHRICESHDELAALLDRTQNEGERARLQMLLMLVDERGIVLEEIARKLGRSLRTIKRWMRDYRDGGIEELIGRGILSQKPERLVSQLSQAIEHGGLSSVSHLGRWLRRNASTSQRKYLGEMVVVDSRGEHNDRSGEVMSTRVVEFLNHLSPGDDPAEWTGGYRNALQALLPDVDRVSIIVNVHCDLAAPASYRPHVTVSQHMPLQRTTGMNGSHIESIHSSEERKQGNEPVAPPPGVATARHGHRREVEERLIENFRRSGFPFEDYHSPYILIYNYREVAYLGAVVLWREQTKPPIPESTLGLMESLGPFVEFLLSDLVVRHRYFHPVVANYMSALEELARSVGLTTTEQEVVVMLSKGYTQKAMAASLGVSQHTVVSHLKTIYRKAGVRSATELIARYLTPLGG